MRDQQRLLEGQIATVEGLLRNVEAERDAERKEMASLRQQISLLQAQQSSVRRLLKLAPRIYSQAYSKTLEQAKRQVAEAEKEKNRVVYASHFVLHLVLTRRSEENRTTVPISELSALLVVLWCATVHATYRHGQTLTLPSF